MEDRQTRIDHLILSSNIGINIRTLSNSFESDVITASPLETKLVALEEVFEYIGVTRVDVEDKQLRVLKGMYERHLSFTIVPDSDAATPLDPMKVSYWIAGLKDLDNLPPWQPFFYHALVLRSQQLYKLAFIEYAVAFEAALNHLLRRQLEARYGAAMREYLLDKTKGADIRWRTLVPLATGHKVTEERQHLYNQWFNVVAKNRNEILHGGKVELDDSLMLEVHRIVYHTIRWLEDAEAG